MKWYPGYFNKSIKRKHWDRMNYYEDFASSYTNNDLTQNIYSIH